jgi:hypothetical protein
LIVTPLSSAFTMLTTCPDEVNAPSAVATALPASAEITGAHASRV